VCTQVPDKTFARSRMRENSDGLLNSHESGCGFERGSKLYGQRESTAQRKGDSLRNPKSRLSPIVIQQQFSTTLANSIRGVVDLCFPWL
jgi:hypothetical protein